MEADENNHSMSSLIKGSDIDALQRMINNFSTLTGYCIVLLDRKGSVTIRSENELAGKGFDEKNDHLCFNQGTERHKLAGELLRARGPVLKRCNNGLNYIAIPVRLKGNMFGSIMLSHFRLISGKSEELNVKSGEPGLSEDRARRIIGLLADTLSKGLLEHIEHIEKLKIDFDPLSLTVPQVPDWMMNSEPVSEVSAVEALIRLEQVQAALKSSEARYRTLVANIPATVYRCEISPPWYMHYISDAITLITGYAPEDFYRGGKKTYADIIHADDLQLVIDAIQNSLQEEAHYEVEYRIIDVNGAIHWVFERGRYYLDEHRCPLYLDGVIMDITEKRRSQKEKLEIEMQFKEIFDHMLEGVALHELIYDEQGNQIDYIIRNMNPSYAELLNLKPEETINHRASEVFPSNGLPYLSVVSEVLRTGVPITIEDYFVQLNKYLHISIFSLEPGHFTTVLLDITHLHEIQNQLQSALDEKEVLIKEVHHRVKNNLQSIIHLIENQMDVVKDKQSKMAFLELKNQAYTMALVYDQLNRAKQLSKIEMKHYLEELTMSISEAFHRSDAILATVESDEIWMDVSLAMPCAMIMNELITNVHKYAFPPGTPGDHHLWIRLLKKEHHYELFVRDNGVGTSQPLELDKLTSSGLQLVKLWVVHQLGGVLLINGQGGFTIEISFPEKSKHTL